MHQKFSTALLLGNTGMHIHTKVQDDFHFYRLLDFELFNSAIFFIKNIHMPQIGVYLHINHNHVLHIIYC